jgi:hypothetical protein
MEWSPISEKELTAAVKTVLNWRASGRDQIPNFWFNQLTVTHKHLATLLTN